MRIKNHERLMLWRKRAGLSQLDLAKRLGLSYRQYAQMERGPLHSNTLRDIHEYDHTVDPASLGQITAGERCLLVRLRAGKTQAQVALELGCCRRWVMLMEKGLAPVDDLTWYWEQ